jgi:hypothetical protein
MSESNVVTPDPSPLLRTDDKGAITTEENKKHNSSSGKTEREVVQEEDEDDEEEDYNSDDSQSWGPYYWNKNQQAEDTKEDTEESVGRLRKFRDLTVWSVFHVHKRATFVGDVFANFFGLDQSRYKWVEDAIRKEKEDKEQAQLEERQRLELALQTDIRDDDAA